MGRALEPEEYVRRIAEDFNREGLEATIVDIHPELEAIPFDGFPGRPRYEGRAGWRELIGEWLQTFDDYRVDFEHAVPFADGVVALYVQRGKIRSGGDPISMPVGAVWRDFSDGPPRRVRFFPTWEAALDEAGVKHRAVG